MADRMQDVVAKLRRSREAVGERVEEIEKERQAEAEAAVERSAGTTPPSSPGS